MEDFEKALGELLCEHQCQIDGFILITDTMAKGVPELKAVPRVGEDQDAMKSRVDGCKTQLDELMQKHSKTWRVSGAVLNGSSRIQVDIVDLPAEQTRPMIHR